MPCLHINNGVVCYNNEFEVIGKKTGRKYRFEWHPFCGPMWLTKKGTERIQVPQEAWDALDKWLKSPIGRKENPPLPRKQRQRLEIK